MIIQFDFVSLSQESNCKQREGRLYMPKERKKTYDFKKKTSSVYFGKKLEEALSYWKEETGGKEYNFAKRIGVSKDMIPRYKKGEAFPDDETFGKMIDVFFREVSDPVINYNFFIPSGTLESIKYSESKNNEIMKGLHDKAKTIGLDESLLCFLEEKTSFNEEYPFWTNLDNQLTFDFNGKGAEIVRLKKGDVKAKVESPYQIEREGNRYNLLIPDLYEIKRIQDKLAEYANYLFYLRRKEMDEQLRKANELNDRKYEEGVQYCPYLSGNDLNSIDPYTQPTEVLRASITDKKGDKNGKHNKA